MVFPGNGRRHWLCSIPCYHLGMGQNNTQGPGQGTAGFSPSFHLPGFHFGVPMFDPQPPGNEYPKTAFGGLNDLYPNGRSRHVSHDVRPAHYDKNGMERRWEPFENMSWSIGSMGNLARRYVGHPGLVTGIISIYAGQQHNQSSEY